MTKDERDQKALANDGLIHNVAKRYASLASYEELYQEGFCALLEAVDKFDEKNGACFSTYATIAIQNALKRYVIGDNPIPIPEYLNTKMLALSSTIQAIENDNLTITPELIAERMDITIKLAKELLDNYTKKILVSMDSVVQETGDTIGSLMACPLPSVDDEVANGSRGEEIYNAICKVFDERTADVVCYYWGIGCDSHTLDETGIKFELTKERIRQLIAKVIKDKPCNSSTGAKRVQLRRLLKGAL